MALGPIPPAPIHRPFRQEPPIDRHLVAAIRFPWYPVFVAVKVCVSSTLSPRPFSSLHPVAPFASDSPSRFLLGMDVPILSDI